MTIEENLTLEEWRDIPGYDGIYRVSQNGRIQTRIVPGLNKAITFAPWREKATRKNKHGYMLVNLTYNRKRRVFYVHSIVALSFLGPRPNGAEVDHIDGNRCNNSISNLRYVTHKENQANPISRERRILSGKMLGSAIYQKTKDGLTIASFNSIREASRMTGISREVISRVANKKLNNKTAGGYLWEFAKII